MRTSGFRRRRDGRIVAVIDDDEAEVMRQVVADVATIVANPPDDAMRNRLYPRAYLDPTEEEAESDFRALMQDDLVRERLAALSVITDALADRGSARRRATEIVLDDAAAEAWLTALNDARLVLGTMLGVTEEEELEFAGDDPRFAYAAIYHWLTGLQFELVECLAGALEADGDDS